MTHLLKFNYKTRSCLRQSPVWKDEGHRKQSIAKLTFFLCDILEWLLKKNEIILEFQNNKLSFEGQPKIS
jgi:hypothetical protein